MVSEEVNKVSKFIEKEIERLIYHNPKCDFEHIWNQAINSCADVVRTWQDDEYVGINDDKLNEYYIEGKKEK